MAEQHKTSTNPSGSVQQCDQRHIHAEHEWQNEFGGYFNVYCPGNDGRPAKSRHFEEEHENMQDPDIPLTEPLTFHQELVILLNKHSMENYSGTPDWILAEYLSMSLRAWDLGIRLRSDWRGENLELPALQRLQQDSAFVTKIKSLVEEGVVHLNPEFRNTQLYSDLKTSDDQTSREVPLVIYTNGQRNEIGTARITVTPGEMAVEGTITGALPVFEAENVSATYSIDLEEPKDEPEPTSRFGRYQQKGLTENG